MKEIKHIGRSLLLPVWKKNWITTRICNFVAFLMILENLCPLFRIRIYNEWYRHPPGIFFVTDWDERRWKNQLLQLVRKKWVFCCFKNIRFNYQNRAFSVNFWIYCLIPFSLSYWQIDRIRKNGKNTIPVQSQHPKTRFFKLFLVWIQYFLSSR